MSNHEFDKPEYSYRVFLSYAHADRALVHELARVLTEMGLEPLWDVNIKAGTPFTEAIKALIERSHLFMPVLTGNSQSRPWVHQETGYAIALNIPVLPITIGNLPTEMISAYQAISVREDLSDLPAQLHKVDFKRLIVPDLIKPPGMIKLAEWPETRSELLMRYANWVLEIGKRGHVCQIGAFTSFAIPNREIDDPIWNDWDGNRLKSEYSRNLLLKERQALEAHAREAGCSLIFHPESKVMSQRGATVQRAHLQTLLEFLEGMPSNLIRAVMTPKTPEESLIVVGDYFSAEGLVPTLHGLHQTVFNSHAPSVLEKVIGFNRKFEVLGNRYGILDGHALHERIEHVLRLLESE